MLFAWRNKANAYAWDSISINKISSFWFWGYNLRDNKWYGTAYYAHSKSLITCYPPALTLISIWKSKENLITYSIWHCHWHGQVFKYTCIECKLNWINTWLFQFTFIWFQIAGRRYSMMSNYSMIWFIWTFLWLSLWERGGEESKHLNEWSSQVQLYVEHSVNEALRQLS